MRARGTWTCTTWRPPVLDTLTAEHEAAHVVVGLALGLKLVRAHVAHARPEHDSSEGFAWFKPGRAYMAFGIMTCAGIAWENRPGGTPEYASFDMKLAKQVLRTNASVRTGVRLARELLDGRRRLHARVAAELCDRDLTAADVDALVLEL